MKRLLILIGLLLCASPVFGQNTAIVATIRDPSGNVYAFATGSARIVCPGNQQPTINGSPVINLSVPITGLDGNGHFTQTLLDVNTMVPATCAYVFAFTAQDGKTSFTTGQIGGVTGAGPVDLSTAINVYAVPLPTVSNPASLGGLNTWTQLQTFGGGLTLPIGQTATVNGALTANGNTTTTGQTNLCAYNFNNIIFVDALTCTTPKYMTIQAAFNAATTPGAEIYVPCGTYTLSSAISWPSLPINFHGEDRNCVSLNFTFGGSSGAAISPWYGSSVHGFYIHGCGACGTNLQALNGGAAVWATAQSYTTANNNLSPTFANANGLIFGVIASCTSSSTTEPTWPTALGGTVTPGGTDTCTYKALWPAAKHYYDNLIDNWSGQFVNSGGFAYGDDVHDNVFRSAVTEVVLAGINSQKLTYTNNTCDNIATDCFDINASKVKIIGNTCSRVGTGSLTQDHECISIHQVDSTHPVTDIDVIGNVMHAGGAGVNISGINGGTMSRIQIIGNNIQNMNNGAGSNGDGIDLDCNTGTTQTYNNVTIANNTMDTFQRYGICVNNGATATISNTLIMGNIISGSGTTDLATVGSLSTSEIGNQLLTSGKEWSSSSDTNLVVVGTVIPTGSATLVPSTLSGNNSAGSSFFRWGGAATQQLGTDGTNTFFDTLGILNFRTNAGATRATLSAAGVLQVNGASANQVAAEIVNGNTALNTASVTTATCDGGKAVTATGALSTDAVDWSFNAAPTATNKYGAFLQVYAVPSTNTVTFYTCNPSATTSTPTAMTVNWSVRRP